MAYMVLSYLGLVALGRVRTVRLGSWEGQTVLFETNRASEYLDITNCWLPVESFEKWSGRVIIVVAEDLLGIVG